jgi:hypothetical protein
VLEVGWNEEFGEGRVNGEGEMGVGNPGRWASGEGAGEWGGCVNAGWLAGEFDRG